MNFVNLKKIINFFPPPPLSTGNEVKIVTKLCIPPDCTAQFPRYINFDPDSQKK